MSSDLPSSFASVEDELAYYKQRWQDEVAQRSALQEEYDDHRALYDEMEREVRYLENERNDFKLRWEKEASERTSWMEKYNDTVRQHSTALSSLQRDLEKYIQLHDQSHADKRNLEQTNDELERRNRAVESSLADLETRYHQLLERNVLLESEIEAKSELDVHLQRCRDEIRDLQVELSVRTSQHHPSSPARSAVRDPNAMDVSPVRPSSVISMASVQSSAAVRSEHSDQSTLLMDTSRIRVNGASPDMPSLVQQMMGRVKSLESRLANCRMLISPLLTLPPDQTGSQPKLAVAKQATPVDCS
ncbi:NADH:ubiquinone oxidoreductase [Sorochytrium milnesiophthora]